MFLIDGSGSIEAAGRGNFRRCIEFVKNMVSSFSVSPLHTRVGVALFSSRTWLILDFHQSRSKATVLRRISTIRYPRGGTKIGRALNFVLHRLFRRSRRALKVMGKTDSPDHCVISPDNILKWRCQVEQSLKGVYRDFSQFLLYSFCSTLSQEFLFYFHRI